MASLKAARLPSQEGYSTSLLAEHLPPVDPDSFVGQASHALTAIDLHSFV